jgi:hypothetical protein
MELQVIQNKIYEIRGVKVMLDRDLAAIYGIETKRLKEAVRRNIERFEGDDFMFELSFEEINSLEISLRSQNVILNDDANYLEINSRCQIGTLDNDDESNSLEISLRSQIATLNSGRGQHAKYTSFAFTEMGVAMLSSVLNSPTAISVNRSIMRAFVAMRQLVMNSIEIRQLALENAEIRKELELLRIADENILGLVNETRQDIDTLGEAIGVLADKVMDPPKPPRVRIGYRTSNFKEYD